MKKLLFLTVLLFWIYNDVQAQGSKLQPVPSRIDMVAVYSAYRDTLLWVVDINLSSLGGKEFATKASFKVKKVNAPSFIKKGAKGKGFLAPDGKIGRLKITEMGGRKLRRPFTVNLKYKGSPPKLN